MTVKIIYRTVKKNDTRGYLKIRITQNRRTTIKSLGIKILGTNWNDSKQVVTSREPNYKVINEKITETLKELSTTDQPQLAIKTSTKYIIEYYDEIISNIPNLGTKKKNTSIRNKFKSYLDSINLNDLEFSNLDINHIQSFFKYMLENGYSNNTAIDSLKKFRQFINKAIKSGLVYYTVNPFTLDNNKRIRIKNIKALTEIEVKKIMTTQFKEFRKKTSTLNRLTLDTTANIFLFQIFTQGIRIADIQLMRWNEFYVIDNNIIVEYTQHKTKKPMQLKLTLLTLSYLNERIFKLHPTFKITLDRLNLERERISENLNDYENKISATKNKDEINKLMLAFHKAQGEDTDYDVFKKLYDQFGNDKMLLMYRDMLNQINTKIYESYCDIINKIISSNNKNSFVFHFLRDSEFEDYRRGQNLTIVQDNRIKASRNYQSGW